MKVYITASSAITAQNTFDKEKYLDEWMESDQPYFSAIEPDYKSFIDPKLLRRMSRIIKMSVAAGTKALADAGVEQPGAIVVGTGLGCIKDTEKFLKDIIEANEGLVSPTAFIQSTHNTVAGQLALSLNCPSDNFTYVNRGHSFENALFDAILRVKEGTDHVLLGGADEMTPAVHEAMTKMECAENWFLGEGACFFTLSYTSTSGAVCIDDLYTFNNPDPIELEDHLNHFLQKNDASIDQIDALLVGVLPSGSDQYYDEVLKKFSDDVPVVNFKKITGDYFTASAFAHHLGVVMLQKQQIFKNTLFSGNIKRSLQKVLIYNHHKGVNHSLSLLSL